MAEVEEDDDPRFEAGEGLAEMEGPDGALEDEGEAEFPLGTVAMYGPDRTITTKIVAAAFMEPGAEPILERRVGTDVVGGAKAEREIQAFFGRHGVRRVVATSGNIGCPHEEGEDFPVGQGRAIAADCLAPYNPPLFRSGLFTRESHGSRHRRTPQRRQEHALQRTDGGGDRQ